MATRFDAEDTLGKARCKGTLAAELELQLDSGAPLAAVLGAGPSDAEAAQLAAALGRALDDVGTIDADARGGLERAEPPTAETEPGPAETMIAAQEPAPEETVIAAQEPAPAETMIAAQEPAPAETVTPAQKPAPAETVMAAQEPATIVPRAPAPPEAAPAVLWSRAPAEPPTQVQRRRPSRQRALLAALVALLVVVGVVVALLASSGGGGGNALTTTSAPGPVVPPTNSPPKILSANPPVSVGSPISLGKDKTPTVMAADGKDVWVAARGELAHIVGATATPVTLADNPTSVAVDPQGRVWMTGVGSTHVAMLDPRAGNRLTPINAGPDPTAIAMSGDAAWIASSSDSTVTRVDLSSPTSTRQITVSGTTAALGEAYGRIWVASTNRSVTVLQDDGTRDSIAAPNVPGRTVGIAQSAGVWFLAVLGNTVGRLTRVDPRQSAEVNTPNGPQYSKHPDRAAVGPLPGGVGAINNDFSIWVLSQGDGILRRFGTGGQPAPSAKPDRRLIAQIQFPSPGYLAVGDHVLWVDIPSTGQVYPITF
jgi:streptogramin lyase